MLQLAEVQVWGPNNIGTIRNIAPGKSASQISTWDSSSQANSAIDGDTGGNFSTGSVSHTKTARQDWWELDLGAVYEIDNINLYNRTDCCSQRLRDFHVFISDEPFLSKSLAETKKQGGVLNLYHAGQAPRHRRIDISRTGRYVRIQLTRSEYLQLGEVQVMANPTKLTNVALRKTASQSTTYTTRAPASKLTDGSIDGRHGASLAITNRESRPWMQVDLGRNYNLSTISLYNRSDCCMNRLYNFYVMVSDKPFTSNDLLQSLGRDDVTAIYHDGAAGRVSSLSVGKTARYVRVQLTGTTHLQISEIKAFAK